MSRVVLARDATSRITDAHCAGFARQWARWEADHSQAHTPTEAAMAAQSAAALCEHCPVLAACARWAETEQYTGLAAGTVYENGRPRPHDWVAPGPKPAAKVS